MWHHLRARFHKIKLRVLHPGISAHHTVDILRGLPEGSRLSQHWCIRNRMQINTEKTQIMAFFETPALLRARAGGVNTSPAQLCPHSTCTHPFQPPTLARILSSKSPNLSTLGLFWILNSLCTSQLWKPSAVLPRVRPLP